MYYDEFENCVNTLAQQIKLYGFQPDYIVGIVRGGSIPAVYLSHQLDIPVVMLHWSTRDSEDKESITWIPEDLLAGKKILLVDDIVDSGKTIQEIFEDWQACVHQDLPLDNIKIASLVYNTSQPVKVDFYCQVIDREKDDTWIIFPWEVK